MKRRKQTKRAPKGGKKIPIHALTTPQLTIRVNPFFLKDPPEAIIALERSMIVSDYVDGITGEVHQNTSLLCPTTTFIDEHSYNKQYEDALILRDDLSRTALNVLQLIESIMARMPITEEYISYITIPWQKEECLAKAHPYFINKIKSKRLFYSGMQELIENGWLERSIITHDYWLNFNRLFRGDRSTFLSDQQNFHRELEFRLQQVALKEERSQDAVISLPGSTDDQCEPLPLQK